MATNFDATRLAVQTAFPTNDLLFDDKEMPSIHVFIPKFRLCDVLSTQSTETHPAFIVNGKEIDGFWVGKYQSTCTDTVRDPDQRQGRGLARDQQCRVGGGRTVVSQARL